MIVLLFTHCFAVPSSLQIRKLYGREIRTLPIVLFVVLSQTFLAWYLTNASWPLFLLVAYVYGGTVNHTMQLAAHELSHNRCFLRPNHNKWLAIVSNFPTFVPSAITFQRYHMEHHQEQGVLGVDVDVLTDMEVNVIGNSTWKKFLFITFQSAFYALRPLLVNPKAKASWEYTNIACQLTYDALIYMFLGWNGVLYLLLSTFFGHGLHPVAGHFIAEHYTFTPGHETYSYYGPVNYVNFNVGYHNEHHDFPLIPWSNLPKVKEIAPEFYNDLPCYTSYTWVLWNFITNPAIGAHSRVKRAGTTDFQDSNDHGLELDAVKNKKKN